MRTKTMNIENYNESLKAEYRTLVTAYLKTNPDRDDSALQLLSMAQSKGLTDKETMTADWLRQRVYQPDKYKFLPEWLAKAAYYCLLDNGEWAPGKGSEWFAMIGIFVREEGGDSPEYAALCERLPHQLEGELGFKWLQQCIEAVSKLRSQTPVTAPESSQGSEGTQVTFQQRIEYTNKIAELPRKTVAYQILLLLVHCHQQQCSSVPSWTDTEGAVFFDSARLFTLTTEKTSSNFHKTINVLIDEGFINSVVVSKEGEVIGTKPKPGNQSGAVRYVNLAEKGQIALGLI